MIFYVPIFIIVLLIIIIIVLRYYYFGNNVKYGPALLKNEVVRGYNLNKNCKVLSNNTEENMENDNSFFPMFKDLNDSFNRMEQWLFRNEKETEPPVGGLNITKKLGIPFISNKDNSDLEFSLSFWLYLQDGPDASPDQKPWSTIVSCAGHFPPLMSSFMVEYSPGQGPCSENQLCASSNQIRIGISTNFPQQEEESYNSGAVMRKYTISDIPVQKWINIVLSLDGRNYDFYLNGELVRSFLIDQVPRISYDNLVLFPQYGTFPCFAKVTCVRFFSSLLNVQQIRDLYNYHGSRPNPPQFGPFWWTVPSLPVSPPK